MPALTGCPDQKTLVAIRSHRAKSFSAGAPAANRNGIPVILARTGGVMIRSQYDRRPLLASVIIAMTISAGIFLTPKGAFADEGGVSFWVPGLFGSLAAAPQVPGWQFAAINYYTNVSASGTTAASREITIGRLNPTVNVSANVNLHAQADLAFLIPSYVFATPVFGGQFAVSMLAVAGTNHVNLDGTITAGVRNFSVTRQGSIGDTTTGVGDLYPMATLRWNSGVNNFMIFVDGDIPVGQYNSSQLANIGIGHGAIDGGVGYTYFDEKAGHEFSAVAGLTGNFENHSTNYTNGLDFHLDWAAAQFLSKEVFVGLVGYVYDQLTPDSGCHPIICPFESRVIGVGPQLGYLFPVGNMQGYLNLKGYGEFDNNARPDGFNLWLTFSLSPAPPSSASSAPPIVTKTPRS
jgi:hypothetical protein